MSLEYLAGQELYWINLHKSRDRALHMEEHVLPLFEWHHRVEAVEAKLVPSVHVIQFVEGWRQLWDDPRAKLSHANQPPGRRFRSDTQKANIAIKWSHLNAIRTGLRRSSEDVFFVAEDDIMPRSTLLAGQVPEPPDDADVAIWSGGLPMAAVTNDDRDFQAGGEHRWVEVTKRGAMNCLGAGLYEIRGTDVAEKLLETEDIPMSWDHAWGFALRHMKVYRLKANAFAQAGVSVRNGKDRKPVITR